MSDTCHKCGVHDPDDKLGYHYFRNLDTDHGSHRWCGPCAVRQWECPIRFVFHLGIPDVVQERFLSLDMLKRFSNWDLPHKDLPIHVFDRRESETLAWMERWALRRSGRPEELYSYRGWCAWSEIILLFDESETVDSIEWILYHEIGHAVCKRAKLFDQAMDRENALEGRSHYEWKDDIGHEADSEERLVNRMATAYMGGKERARPWWRPRVTARDRGYTVLPDAFAAETTPEYYMFALAKAEGWASPLPIHGFDPQQLDRFQQRYIFVPPPSEEQRKQSEFRTTVEQWLAREWSESLGTVVPKEIDA